MPPDELVIRDLRADDVAAAIEVLTVSFADFPVFQIMAGTDAGAAERIARVFAMEFEPEAGSSALLAELDGRIVGVLTHLDSPGCSAMSAFRLVRFMRIAGPRLFRTMSMFDRIERAHPRTRHRHLPSVGVLPEQQGRGVGSGLMEAFGQRCDADRIEAYLETIRWSDPRKPSHERFYGRLGYDITTEIPMTDEWSVLTMTRPAMTSQARSQG
jgi:GNAT superfamily N-acetyltransferase